MDASPPRQLPASSSINDVARATGVSTATVSRALRGLPNVSETTRAIVRQAAAELGYVPSSSAAGLASGRTMAMGVVVPTLELWFYSTVLEGVDAVLRRAGYDLILFNLGDRHGERERVFDRSILRKRTDALIALCVDFSAEERRQLASTGHPTVIVGGAVRGLRHVAIDQLGAARMATEHLIGLGHRDIAHVAGDAIPGYTKDAPEQRRRGFQNALAAHGLQNRPEWTVHGAFDLATARRAVAELLERPGPRPTAIFADSDEMAIGAMVAARSAGLQVPDDLSIIGIDDHRLAAPFELTTVAQDPFEQGALAARMLLEELRTRTPVKRSVRMPVHLIVRGSTAAPPVAAPASAPASPVAAPASAPAPPVASEPSLPPAPTAPVAPPAASAATAAS
jgi:DNA-binding LacI/PurR family transcriptional regulator